MLLVACNVEDPSAAEGTIRAVIENEGTRTAVNDEGIFTWSDGDQVWLHTTNGGITGTLSSGSGTSDANFSYGVLFGEMTGKAVYPYNAGHSISGDCLNIVLPASYDLGTAFTNTNAAMYGVNRNGTIKFKHLAGVMSFVFKNTPAGVDRFEITLDKKINGSFTADLTAAYPQIEAVSTSEPSEQTVTLNFDALTTTSELNLYVPLPVGTYNTLTLGLYAGDETIWTYSNTVTNTISRKTLKLMPTVTVGSSISGEIENPTSGSSELFASMELINGPKTTMDENNNVLWPENDQLIAFMRSTSGQRYQIKEQYIGTTTGGFRRVADSGAGDAPVPGDKLDHNVVIYPYSPATHCIKNDSLSPA